MADKVLLDTSIWIDYFQKSQSPVKIVVEGLLKNRQAVFTGVIALELIRGARSAKELAILSTLFTCIERINECDTTHLEAGNMGYQLARKGIIIGTVDLIIGQLALENNLSLYTQDRHFSMMISTFPLKIYNETAPC